MPTFGALFDGIGGFSLGLERAGWAPRWQVENDPFCTAVLARHWPDVRRYGDIRDVDWSAVEPVDLICGGFPCQPISNAGQRRGRADERWLWPEFARAIRDVRPGHVLVENVAALLGRGLGDVLGDLAALGYDAEWDCLPAFTVGAPHTRDRIWIVAHADSGQSERGRDARLVAAPPRPGAGEVPERERLRDAAGNRGPAVADASAGGRRQGRGHGDRYDGAAHGSRPGEPRRSGSGGPSLADADGLGVRRRSHVGGEAAGGRAHATTARRGRRVGGPVADAIGEGLEGRDERAPEEPPGRRPDADAAGSGGGTNGLGPAESRLGRDADGLPGGLDGHRWPAPPGVPQSPWEPARLVTGQPPNRARRVGALGNALIPQIVEAIGLRLMADYRTRRAGRC